MKIEMELKDHPKGKPTICVKLDTAVHLGVSVRTLVSAAKKQYPWVKIIDLRIDLR